MFNMFRSCICVCLVPYLLTGCAQDTESSLTLAKRGAYDVAFHSQHKQLLISTLFENANVWQLSPFERQYIWHHDNEQAISQVSISADGQYGITTEFNRLALWDMTTGQNARFWQAPAEIFDVTLSASGRFAALALANHMAVVFDALNGGGRYRLPHKDQVNTIDWRQSRIITSSDDGSAIVWSSDNGQALKTLSHSTAVQFAKLSKDADYAITFSQYDGAYFWHITSGESLPISALSRSRIKRGLSILSANNIDGTQDWLRGLSDNTVLHCDSQHDLVKKRWRITKKQQWKPTATHILLVDTHNDNGLVVTSDARVHFLK